MNVVADIKFPEFSGLKCDMMPFIQGYSDSLPETFQAYADIIENYYIEKGELGHLTIHESYVEAGKSQRGYNYHNASRNVHIEVGRFRGKAVWGGFLKENKLVNRWGNSWGASPLVTLDDDTEILIANSIDDTCRVWDRKLLVETPDGDLSEYLDHVPVETGVLMKANQLVRMSIFTPHECINQDYSGPRQFFRIVGAGVTGREHYFTINPLLSEKMIEKIRINNWARSVAGEYVSKKLDIDL